MTTEQPIPTIAEAQRFISDLGLMVRSVHQRAVAPTRAIVVIDEFVGRLKANESDDFKRFERICLSAREAIEAYRTTLN